MAIVWTLAAAQFVISLGGWLLHTRIHTPFAPDGGLSMPNAVPFIAGIIDVTGITLLVLWRKTVAIGFVLNGLFVIVGIIMMLDYSADHMAQGATARQWLFESTVPDILILLADFLIVRAIWQYYRDIHKVPGKAEVKHATGDQA